MPLTPKQEKFWQYYAANPNATEAALRAGYSKKTAASQGQRLLKHVEIKKRLAGMAEIAKVESEKKIYTAAQRQAFWTQVLEDKSVKMADRLKASELLGKSQGDFIERVENSGSLEISITRKVVNAKSGH